MNTKSSMLSLILMHDDGEARSIRISKNGLWLLVILTILAPITGLIGIWIGWEAWQSMSNWQQEKLAYQIQIDELRVQLERFATLEALLKRQDAALSSKVDLPSHQKQKTTSDHTPSPSSKKVEPKNIQEKGVMQSLPSQSPQHKSISQSPTLPSISNSNSASIGNETLQQVTLKDTTLEQQKENSKENVQRVLSSNSSSLHSNNNDNTSSLPVSDVSATTTTTTSSSSLPSDNMSDIDYGVVKVENVQRQIIQGKRIQAQIGLFNTEKVPQLSGHVQFALITNDGKKYALFGSDTSFRITRFKSMFIDSELPVSESVAEKSKLLVEVVSGDKVVYRHLYPLIEN